MGEPNTLQIAMDTIREEFFKRLERKTGWGKEELKREYVEAERDALVRFWEIGKQYQNMNPGPKLWRDYW